MTAEQTAYVHNLLQDAAKLLTDHGEMQAAISVSLIAAGHFPVECGDEEASCSIS